MSPPNRLRCYPLRDPGRDPRCRGAAACLAAQDRHVRAADLEALATAALAAAAAQHVTVPGEAVAADLIRGLASEALPDATSSPPSTSASRRSWPATLTRPSSAACRGWGHVDGRVPGHHRRHPPFASGDQLAAAAGWHLCSASPARSATCSVPRPATKSSSACSTSLPSSPPAATRPARPTTAKRSEARHITRPCSPCPRVNVLHAMLRNRTPYQAPHADLAA